MSTELTQADREGLAASQLFRSVDIDQVSHLLKDCTVRNLRANETLLAVGAPPSPDVFVVIWGRLSVHLGGSDSPCHAVISAGECVGEMSALEGQPVSASVVAVRETRLLAIPQSVVWSLVNASHAVAQNLLHVLFRRMRRENVVMANVLDRQRELEHSATTDSLTGLQNRRWMSNAFDRQLKRCAHDSVPVGLVLIDIDGLKAFNDRAGHLSGDRLLCVVAGAVSRRLRPGDFLVRFGGDEFCVLLPNAALSGALIVAERLRAAVAIETSDSRLNVSEPATISCGVSSSPPASTLEELLQAADEALSRAKEKGGNAVSV